MAKVILCRGIQGSGKTTYAKEYCKLNPNTVRINRDDIRAMFSQKWSNRLEEIVITTEHNIILSALCSNYDVIIDDVSNLNDKTIKMIKDTLSSLSMDVEIEYKDFFIPLQECIDRDSKRENPIGEEIIKNTYNKYKHIIETALFNSIQTN